MGLVVFYLYTFIFRKNNYLQFCRFKTSAPLSVWESAIQWNHMVLLCFFWFLYLFLECPKNPKTFSIQWLFWVLYRFIHPSIGGSNRGFLGWFPSLQPKGSWILGVVRQDWSSGQVLRTCSLAWQQKWRRFKDPRGSMGMVYLPTFSHKMYGIFIRINQT